MSLNPARNRTVDASAGRSIIFEGYCNTMAKKVLPVHLDKRERQVLELISARDGISMAEVIRRAIRGLALEVLPTKAAPAVMETAPTPLQQAEAH